MLDKKVSGLLNAQINKELFSAYIYLDISNYFYDQGLEGFGSWYKIQAKEEQDHADLILQYLQNNGEKITLEAIDKPNHSYTAFKDALLVSLRHERYVTELIHAIYAAAVEVKDYRTMQFLDWFVKEQGEEEKNTEDMIKKYDLFGSDAKALYMLDNELKARTYAPPSLVL